MFRFVVSSLIILSLPALAEPPPTLEEIANSQSEEELAAIALRVDARESFLLERERKEHGDLLYAIGLAWYDSRENDKARAVFEKLLVEWEESHGGVAALGLGNVYWRLDRIEDAVAFFERALVAQDVRTSWGVLEASSTRNHACFRSLPCQARRCERRARASRRTLPADQGPWSGPLRRIALHPHPRRERSHR